MAGVRQGTICERMSVMLPVLVTLIVILGSGCGERAAPQAERFDAPLTVATPPVGKLVDLTHPFDEHTIYWPTEKGFLFDRGNNGVTAKGYYYAANRARRHAPRCADPLLR